MVMAIMVIIMVVMVVMVVMVMRGDRSYQGMKLVQDPRDCGREVVGVVRHRLGQVGRQAVVGAWVGWGDGLGGVSGR